MSSPSSIRKRSFDGAKREKRDGEMERWLGNDGASSTFVN